MYVAFAFMVFFCICICICIHDLHLYSHLHVCCIGIPVHDSHLWSPFACIIISYFVIYMHMCMYIWIYIHAIMHPTMIWCACTRPHRIIPWETVHTCTCAYVLNMMERNTGQIYLYVPMTHLSVTTKLCMNRLEN